MLRAASALALPLCGVLLAAPAAAQTAAGPPTPALRASRATAPVRVDGRLDDPAWAAAAVAGGFVQRAPDPGAPASQRTEVRVLYDDAALYVAARMHDDRADSIAAPLARRDAGASVYSDWFDVLVDSYHDRRTGFRFGVNPRGVRRDVYHSDDANEDAGWDAVWEAATRVDSAGWTAEIRIPLSQLRFPRAPAAAERTWGVNFSRVLARRDETSHWSQVPANYVGMVSRAGELGGLVGIGTPRRVELLPYTSARLAREPGDPADPFFSASEVGGSAGADVRAGLPGGLTLSATINPDFGQVEVDPATVNLSAFETLLPENRPFFVEGVDIFRFGSLLSFISPGYAPYFYTRRVGRPPQLAGQLPPGLDVHFLEVPTQSTIMGAAKVSGRTPGGWSVGILDAVTGRESGRYAVADTLSGGLRTVESPVEPLTNYFAGRGRRDFGAGNTVVGGIATATHRDMGDGVFDPFLRSGAYVGGIDAEHSWGGRAYSLSGYVAGSSVHGSPEAIALAQRSSARYFRRPDAAHLRYDSTRTSLAGYSAAFAFRKTGDWRGSIYYQEVSPGFETNDSGYQTRADLRVLNALYGYRQSRPGKLFREWFVRAFTAQSWNFGGDRVGASYNLRGNATLHGLWSGAATLAYAPRTLSDRATRGGPLIYSPSAYQVDASLGTDPRRPLSATAQGTYAVDEWEGLIRSASVTLSGRPSQTVRFSLSPSVTTLHDPAQWVTARSDTLARATHGRRDVFATVDQATVALAARLDWTFTPALSLQLYAQPFTSAAEFGGYKELSAPRSFEFDVYGSGAGTIARNDDGTYTADPDGTGPARPLTFGQRRGGPFTGQGDFNVRSLRGNAVLRWEYRPGSTLFFVWQQRREGLGYLGDFDGTRELRGILDAPGSNVFMVKATYWLAP
ncbi:MAG TPA: DUF5916 domain-containing protein [Longimicrobiaceae bacterium]|nr:DUF5916 domain-containing protein [Longimicrobiaceae bacterium]